MIHRTKISTVSDLAVLMTLSGVYLFALWIIASFICCFVRAKPQTFTRSLGNTKKLLLKISFTVDGLRIQIRNCFSQQLLLLSEYIKFWLFALLTEFLNNLIIACIQEGKKNSSHLSYPSYLGRSMCQC